MGLAPNNYPPHDIVCMSVLMLVIVVAVVVVFVVVVVAVVVVIADVVQLSRAVVVCSCEVILHDSFIFVSLKNRQVQE